MFEVLKDKVKEIRRLNTKKGRNEVFQRIFSIKLVQQKISFINTQNQLYEEGIDSNEKKLARYAPTTIEHKIEEGLPFNRTTLFETGVFYTTWSVKAEKNYLIIDADPIKVDKETGEITNLFERYGVDILGLTDDSKEVLIDEIDKIIIDEFRKEILQLNR